MSGLSSEDCVIIDDDDEDTEVTGGKSLSEIVQLLRTSTKYSKSNKGGDEPICLSDMPKGNKLFPWLSKFTSDTREYVVKRNSTMNQLVNQFLIYLGVELQNIIKKPRRATKLRLEVTQFINYFHMLYLDVMRPLGCSTFLEKMCHVVAYYIDFELNAARYGTEPAKKISSRISSTLYICLDNSIEHMLNAVLKSKFFIKKYSNPKINQKVREICLPIIERLLQVEIPPEVKETSYVRFLLAFKVWKKLADSKEQRSKITNLAIEKLNPPSDFNEKLKSGIYSNVLPYVTKTFHHKLTWFFLTSPFNVAEKAQEFLKYGIKNQYTMDLDKPNYDELNLLLDCAVYGTDWRSCKSEDVLNKLWCDLDEKEDEEEGGWQLFLSQANINSEDFFNNGNDNKSKEKVKKSTRDPLTINVDKPPTKKLKVNQLTTGKAIKALNNISVEVSGGEQTLSSVVSSKSPPTLSLSADEKTTSLNSEMSRQKPCATVEPEQSRDSQSGSNTTVLIHHDLSEEGTSQNCLVNQHLPEDQLIFEEVITEEIGPEEDSTLVFLDLNALNDQVNLATESVVNIIDISQETQPDLCTNVGVQTEAVPIIESPITANAPNPSNCNFAKEQTSVSPLGNPILSSEVVVVENKVDDLLLDRAQDTYTYNEAMLSGFLNEGIADEGSDDESNYIKRRKYAGGGKVTAFREQMDDSKSDVGEECESPPSSRSDSQRSIRTPSPTPAPPFISNNLPDTSTQHTEDRTNLGEPCPCRQVSVNLSDVAHNLPKDKSQEPSGMKPPFCSDLHKLTTQNFTNYLNLQLEYRDLYIKNPFGLLTSFCPYILLINRCKCEHCNFTLHSLTDNWNVLLDFRKSLNFSDKDLTYIWSQTEYFSQSEDDISKSSISEIEKNEAEKTSPSQNPITSSIQPESSIVSSVPESNQQVTLKLPEIVNNANSRGKDFSLPPKKRAFNHQISDTLEQEDTANATSKILKMDSENLEEMPLDHRLKENEKALQASDDSLNKSDMTTDSTVTGNRLTGVVIKSVGGHYFAEPKTSSMSEDSEKAITEEVILGEKAHKNKSKSREKSLCRHQLKKLKRQKKRLDREEYKLKKKELKMKLQELEALEAEQTVDSADETSATCDDSLSPKKSGKKRPTKESTSKKKDKQQIYESPQPVAVEVTPPPSPVKKRRRRHRR